MGLSCRSGALHDYIHADHADPNLVPDARHLAETRHRDTWCSRVSFVVPAVRRKRVIAGVGNGNVGSLLNAFVIGKCESQEKKVAMANQLFATKSHETLL